MQTYILTIARYKNMTKAAEELYVSQSSLSQALSKLEQEMGTPLFFRAKGELRLTPAGELYVQASEKMVRIRERLYRDVANLENRGHITVGTTSQYGLETLSAVIPAYKQKYPDMAIELSETSVPMLDKLLVEENIDLGLLSANDVELYGDQAQVLREEEVYFAIPKTHPYYQSHPDTPVPADRLMELFGEDNFLLSRRGATLRVLADRTFERCGRRPSAMCETNSITTTKAMVRAGVGVTFVASSCIDWDDPQVAYYHMSPKLFRFNILVQRRNWVLSRAEQDFRDMLATYVREHYLDDNTD